MRRPRRYLALLTAVIALTAFPASAVEVYKTIYGEFVPVENPRLFLIDLEPGNLDYLYALADHYAKRGDFRRALAVVEQMIETNPAAPIGGEMKAALEQAIAQGGGD